MIDGLSLDYAGARAAARLAWRPDERLWQRLHAARDLRALLDAARSAGVGNYLSGVASSARVDDIDAAFRAQFRARVHELATWSPGPWRPAIRWAGHLADLGAVSHLWDAGAVAVDANRSGACALRARSERGARAAQRWSVGRWRRWDVHCSRMRRQPIALRRAGKAPCTAQPASRR